MGGDARPVRRLELSPGRIEGWLERFAVRHPVASTEVTRAGAILVAVDGAVADCEAPFGPLPAAAVARRDGFDADALAALVAHASLRRTVGVLLVRLGGHAAGVFDRDGALVASKVGTRPVHGRNQAGGQSQQRFARRREGQARVALEAAADVAVRVLVPWVGRLDAVVLGGERRAVDTLRADRRLDGVFALATDRFLDTPDPRHRVLLATPPAFEAVRVRLTEPAS